jgi:predicted nucleotidyltransferase
VYPELSPSLVPPLSAADARAVAAFARRLRQRLGDSVTEIRVFGSKARGDAGPESDIDVLVVVQPETERVRLETAVSDLAFDVSLDHAVHISPCVLTAHVVHESIWSETPFLQTLEREGLQV